MFRSSIGPCSVVSARGLLGCFLVGGFLLGGCGGPEARIKDPSEGSVIGKRRAGAATYNQLVGETVDKLLKTHATRRNHDGRLLIGFVGIDNQSAEELAENKEAIYEQIDTVIVNSGLYSNVSKRFIDAALRETGLRIEQILLREPRARFMSVLGEEGLTPDYFLWGKLTSMSTQGQAVREREYLLTLELLNTKTGQTDAKETSKVTKEYLR